MRFTKDILMATAPIAYATYNIVRTKFVHPSAGSRKINPNNTMWYPKNLLHQNKHRQS